jgi:hypothetical protein
MGCFARLGCLLLLILLGIVAWLTRDRWMSHLQLSRHAPTAAAIQWQPLTAAGARRAAASLDSLRKVNGPVFQNVEPGDAAAYVMQALTHRLPRAADSAAAAVVGDELYVRGNVALSKLGGKEVLGPLASMLGERESMQMAGTFRVVHPGLTEYRVTKIELGPITVPSAVIPRLLARIARVAGLDSVSARALPIPTPPSMVDIRVADGHLTLYKGLK